MEINKSVAKTMVDAFDQFDTYYHQVIYGCIEEYSYNKNSSTMTGTIFQFFTTKKFQFTCTREDLQKIILESLIEKTDLIIILSETNEVTAIRKVIEIEGK